MEPLFFILGFAFFIVVSMFMYGPMSLLKESQPDEYARITSGFLPRDVVWNIFFYLITNDYKKNISNPNIGAQFSIAKYLAYIPFLLVFGGFMYAYIT